MDFIADINTDPQSGCHSTSSYKWRWLGRTTHSKIPNGTKNWGSATYTLVRLSYVVGHRMFQLEPISLGLKFSMFCVARDIMKPTEMHVLLDFVFNLLHNPPRLLKNIVLARGIAPPQFIVNAKIDEWVNGV